MFQRGWYHVSTRLETFPQMILDWTVSFFITNVPDLVVEKVLKQAGRFGLHRRRAAVMAPAGSLLAGLSQPTRDSR